MASATAATARRPTGLILPDTKSPFLHDRMGNHSPCAGPAGIRLTCPSHMIDIVRAQVAHTPRNPFLEEDALEAFTDGAVAFSGGRILACGPWSAVSGAYPEARRAGRAGLAAAARVRRLPRALSAGPDYRGDGARADGLAAGAGAAGGGADGGFGLCGCGSLRSSSSVWPPPVRPRRWCSGRTFRARRRRCLRRRLSRGLRVASGLVVSDRGLLPSLHVSAEDGVGASRELIERWHGRGAAALRGDSALLGVLLRGDAGDVRGASGEAAPGCCSRPT